jgi:hypothetical protein
MSIADAVRARDLETRVAALESGLTLRVALLEHRVAELEKGGGELSDSQATRLIQGQLNSLRAKLDRLTPAGPPGSMPDAA